MSLELVLLDGTGRRFRLIEGQELTVGAAVNCAIRLTAADVSRRHALVALRRGRVVVLDLGSKNGTFVGGKRITAEVELGAGDSVRFSSVAGQIIPETELAVDETATAPPVSEQDDHAETGARVSGALPDSVAELLAVWAEPHGTATGALVDWLVLRRAMRGAAVVELVGGDISVSAASGAMVGLLPRVGRLPALDAARRVASTVETVTFALGDEEVFAATCRGLTWVLVLPGQAMLDAAELQVLVRLLSVAWRLDHPQSEAGTVRPRRGPGEPPA